MESTLTACAFLATQGTRELATVRHEADTYTLRLKRQPGIGCVTVQIRLDGSPKWETLSGRFSDESTLEHVVSHVAEHNLTAGARMWLTDRTMEACGRLDDLLLCGIAARDSQEASK